MDVAGDGEPTVRPDGTTSSVAGRNNPVLKASGSRTSSARRPNATSRVLERLISTMGGSTAT